MKTNSSLKGNANSLLTHKKYQKGITLVTLVITIIIMLILAGVAMVTLTDENGILGQANEAKHKIEESTLEEKVKVAVSESWGTGGKLNYDLLKKHLDNIDGIEGVPSKITDSNFPLKVIINNYEYLIENNGKVTENEKGNLTTNILAKSVLSIEESVDVIGKKITNFKVDGVDGDWLIYYVGKNPLKTDLTENHIYLISEKILDYAALPIDNYTTSDTTTEYASDLLLHDELYPVANEWLSEYVDKNIKTDEDNMKAMLYLLDKNNWTTDEWLKQTSENEIINDYTNLIEYIIGSPTIEMYSASYNSVNRETKEMTIGFSGNVGYITNATSKNWFEQNTLWRTSESKNQYWIASPYYLNDGKNLTNLAVSGSRIYATNYTTSTVGCRPVVCLKSNVSLIANFDENGNIESYAIK